MTEPKKIHIGLNNLLKMVRQVFNTGILSKDCGIGADLKRKMYDPHWIEQYLSNLAKLASQSISNWKKLIWKYCKVFQTDAGCMKILL
jgi:hypothetical protein